MVFLGDSLNGSRPWNLHSVWDWAALSEAGFDWPADSARAIEELRNGIEDVETAYDPVRWTEESFHLTETVVYDLARQTSADRAYLDRAMPVIHARLRQAAARLAALLNAIASNRFGG